MSAFIWIDFVCASTFCCSFHAVTGVCSWNNFICSILMRKYLCVLGTKTKGTAFWLRLNSTPFCPPFPVIELGRVHSTVTTHMHCECCANTIDGIKDVTRWFVDYSFKASSLAFLSSPFRFSGNRRDHIWARGWRKLACLARYLRNSRWLWY